MWILLFSSIDIDGLPNANSISVFLSVNPLIFAATAVAANINGLTDKTTDIEFTLGKLSISIDENNSIHMKGPVSNIKNIEINI